MGVSIQQARSAKKSSRTARSAMTAVQLAAVRERLKSIQEHIRDVAPEKKNIRGYKVGNRFDLIRQEFDNALGTLPKVGQGSSARKQLNQAQTKLNDYQQSFILVPESKTWFALQILVQDTISELSTTTTTMEIKND